MITTGIFGGSFDPIHRGHLEIAKAALREGGVDEVWIMVSPQNPLKQGERKVPVADRLEMARIAVQELPEEYRAGIKVSDFETRLPVPSYTYSTLRALKDAYPERNFRWIIGGDNLDALARWRNAEEIIKEFGLIVYPRPGSDTEKLSKSDPSLVILKNVRLMDISSTAIREAIRRNDVGILQRATGESVASYILQHSLYLE